MEEEYKFTTRVHLTNPKIVLKKNLKVNQLLKWIKLDTIKRLGGHEISQNKRKQLNFWKVVPKCKYLELDKNFEQPFEIQYFQFKKCLDTITLPPLKTLNYLDLKDVTSRRHIGNFVQLKDIEERMFRKTQPAKKSEKKADLLCEKKLDLETGKTLMVYFKIFQQNSLYIKGLRNPPRPKLIYGVILHGDCTLANLRDAIFCEFDYTQCKDREDPQKLNKDRFPSGMFYINNTFYIDKRLPDNEDYSVVVKMWKKTKRIDLGRTYLMESTLIKDLIVRKNYPYLYQHIGNCEHYIVVEQIKVLNEKESHCSFDYPKLYDRNIKNAKNCTICLKHPTDYVVKGSRRTIDDNIRLCKKCCKSFFYIDGLLIEEHLEKFSFFGSCRSLVSKVITV